MSKRLAFLEKLAADGKADAFALYGLAMEYRTLGRNEDAITTFTTLREKFPNYVPAYLMAGQMLSEIGRSADARQWLEAGVVVADAEGNTHAKAEMLTALEECD